MPTATITRQRLVDAVEAGIKKDVDTLTDAEKLMLRHVAQTESLIARGTFSTVFEGKFCGCPLTLAGLWDGDNGRDFTGFWSTFDHATRPASERDCFTPIRILIVEG